MTHDANAATFFGPNRSLATKKIWGPYLIWCGVLNFLRYSRCTDQHFAPAGAYAGFERTCCSDISSSFM